MTVLTAIIELTKASWRVLRSHPLLIWFPIMSLLATFALFLLVGPILGDDMPWLVVLGLVVVMHVIHVYFTVGLTSQALRALRGDGPITVGAGLAAASGRAPAIASFAAVTGSIGFVLEVMGRSRNAALRLARTLFGTAWSLATYLAIPVMVQERRGGIPSLRRSGDLFRRTWGETALSEVGVRIIMQHVMMVLVVIALVVLHVFGESVFTLLVILAVFGAVIGVIGSLEAIYRSALYVFASEGVVPEPFASAELDAIWRTKPAEPPPSDHAP